MILSVQNNFKDSGSHIFCSLRLSCIILFNVLRLETRDYTRRHCVILLKAHVGTICIWIKTRKRRTMIPHKHTYNANIYSRKQTGRIIRVGKLNHSLVHYSSGSARTLVIFRTIFRLNRQQTVIIINTDQKIIQFFPGLIDKTKIKLERNTFEVNFLNM